MSRWISFLVQGSSHFFNVFLSYVLDQLNKKWFGSSVTRYCKSKAGFERLFLSL